MIKPFLPFIKSYLIDPKLYHSLVLNWLPRNNIGSEGFAYKIIFCSTVLWSNGRQYWKKFNCSETSYFNMNLSSQTGSCLPVNKESIWHENFFFLSPNYTKLFTNKQAFIKHTNFYQNNFALKQPVSTWSLNNATLSLLFLKGDCISILDPCKGASS